MRDRDPQRAPASRPRPASGRSRISAIIRLLRIPPRDWAYLAVAVFELLRARLRFAAMSSRELLGELRSRGAEPAQGPQDPLSEERLDRIAWAVAAAARRVPWRADCLVQAMAADRWLRRLGFAPDFFLGVTKAPEGDLLAHAWVRCGEMTVAGGSHERFSVLIKSIETQ